MMMAEMDKVEKFSFEGFKVDEDFVRRRIISTTSALGWQRTIAFALKNGVSFERLRTIEIGCGTGTFSLTLNLLGAETTLVDADESALEAARKVFAVYGRRASYIKANVMDPPPKDLLHKFDIVVSGGLAEHFRGQDRQKIILYHKLLMKGDGFAYIGVPNKLSLCYQAVRLVNRIMGQWKITTEIPFTPAEMENTAKDTGFSNALVIGNFPLVKDLVEHLIALGGAVLEPFPCVKKALKGLFSMPKSRGSVGEPREGVIEMQDFIKERARQVNCKDAGVDFKKSPKDYLSAGIVLFAFGEGMKV